MSSANSSYSYLTALDLYYISTTSNVFLYGLIVLLIVGSIGNTCQIITFSRKRMRKVSTGVLFLALSVSDTMYLLLSTYALVIYGFKVSDRSDYGKTCQFRHFISYLTTNFSAWMLTTIACDRWLRSRFPLKAQRLCTPRMAIYCIIIALIFDCILHVHLLTPMFGQIAPGVTSNCGANRLYPIYSYFYAKIWPTISILTVSIIPAVSMLSFVLAIAVHVKNNRNRVVAFQQHERRRTRFLYRQMLVLMLATIILFFSTTFPVAVFYFAVSTLDIQQSYSFSLLLIAILGVVTEANYSLNFYLHCLTSKLFRKEFCKMFPCSIFINFRRTNIPPTEQHLGRPQPQGTITPGLKNNSNSPV